MSAYANYLVVIREPRAPAFKVSYRPAFEGRKRNL